MLMLVLYPGVLMVLSLCLGLLLVVLLLDSTDISYAGSIGSNEVLEYGKSCKMRAH